MIDVPQWPEDSDWRSRVENRALDVRRIAERETVQRVVEAAIDLVGEIGADFTVQHVADRARVSRRKFYELFPSKDDLCLAMFTEINLRTVAARRRFVDRVSDVPLERLRTCMLKAFDPADAHDPFLRAIALLELRVVGSRADGLSDAAAPWIDYLTELLGACRASGQVTLAVDDERIATYLHMAVHIRLARDRVSEIPTGLPTEPSSGELVALLLGGVTGIADPSPPSSWTTDGIAATARPAPDPPTGPR